MLHVYGKYVVRGSQWVGRGSNAGGLGMSCKGAGAVMLRNHNFDQLCIIVNFQAASTASASASASILQIKY